MIDQPITSAAEIIRLSDEIVRKRVACRAEANQLEPDDCDDCDDRDATIARLRAELASERERRTAAQDSIFAYWVPFEVRIEAELAEARKLAGFVISHDKDADVFVGYFPLLNIRSQAETESDALLAVKSAVVQHVSTLEKLAEERGAALARLHAYANKLLLQGIPLKARIAYAPERIQSPDELCLMDLYNPDADTWLKAHDAALLKQPQTEFAVNQLRTLAEWIRAGNYEPDDTRDEIARVIENRIRALKGEPCENS